MIRFLKSLFPSSRVKNTQLAQFEACAKLVSTRYQKWMDQLWGEYEHTSWQDREARERIIKRYHRLTKRYSQVVSHMLRKKKELIGERPAKVDHITLV